MLCERPHLIGACTSIAVHKIFACGRQGGARIQFADRQLLGAGPGPHGCLWPFWGPPCTGPVRAPPLIGACMSIAVHEIFACGRQVGARVRYVDRQLLAPGSWPHGFLWPFWRAPCTAAGRAPPRKWCVHAGRDAQNICRWPEGRHTGPICGPAIARCGPRAAWLFVSLLGAALYMSCARPPPGRCVRATPANCHRLTVLTGQSAMVDPPPHRERVGSSLPSSSLFLSTPGVCAPTHPPFVYRSSRCCRGPVRHVRRPSGSPPNDARVPCSRFLLPR